MRAQARRSTLEVVHWDLPDSGSRCGNLVRENRRYRPPDSATTRSGFGVRYHPQKWITARRLTVVATTKRQFRLELNAVNLQAFDPKVMEKLDLPRLTVKSRLVVAARPPCHLMVERATY